MNNGIWNAEHAKHHQSSQKLAKWLAGFLPKLPQVLDFGCGNGYYMGYLEQSGFKTIGIDGNDSIEVLCTDFRKFDLADKIDLDIKGSVISFETMEHIPKENELIAFENLINHCDNICIISWASVGQPGIGHINCQNKEYVINLMANKAFILCEEATTDARKNVDKNCDWFERNILIFERCK